jgi:tetratricopeptide (TPR) repeat protein
MLAVLLVGALVAGAGQRHHAALCDAHNIRRASSYLWGFRDDMLRLRPSLPDSARCYFWNLPSWIGFQLADGPAMRIWYGDPTVQGFFLSEYETSATRPSLFFGHDDQGRLFEIVRGRPDPGLRGATRIYADALADLGTRLAEAGETEAAIVEWRKALEVAPELAAVSANLGVTLVQTRRFAEAVPVLEQARRLEPANGEVTLYLVLAHANLGEFDEALRLIEGFLASSPEASLRAEAEALRQRLVEDLR